MLQDESIQAVDLPFDLAVSISTTYRYLHVQIRKTPAWPSFIGYVGVCFLGAGYGGLDGYSTVRPFDKDRLARGGVQSFKAGWTGRGIGEREIGQKQLTSADEKPQIRVDTEGN